MKSNRGGQAMIMTILALGGTMLGATTIAGLLMVYQIRQSTDMANSMKSIYAADAGLEWRLYNFFISSSSTEPSFLDSNTSVSTTIACVPSPCGADPDSVTVRSLGRNGNVNRAFLINF